MKNSIFRKWWFWVIVICVIGIIGSNNEQTAPITPTEYASNTEKINSQASALYNKALSQYQVGDYEKALQLCDEYINKYSNVELEFDINSLKNDIQKVIPNISATELIKAYKDNEVKADTIYKNHLVIVSGIIDSIGKDILDQTYITLNNGDKYSFEYVQCYFSDDIEIGKVAELSKGQNITIIGKCDGAIVLNPSIKNCKIY